MCACVWCVCVCGVCLCAGEAEPLAFLRSLPQFAQLRATIQRNPRMLQPVLQELRQSNPQLLAVSGGRGRGRGRGTVGDSTCLCTAHQSEPGEVPSAHQ